MNHITKQFGNFKANDDITLQVKKGEIHALLGENGAGKSTLMSVLFGLYQPEEGEIRINGKIVNINNPNDANDLGIGMVHQHFKLVHNFTVLESIVLGRETTKMGVLKMDAARKKVMELSQVQIQDRSGCVYFGYHSWNAAESGDLKDALLRQ